jgi:PII-like signaling protein
MIKAPVKMLLIFIDQTDTWQNAPLHEVIVKVLEQNGIAGATVLSGIMGYGTHRRIHRRGLLGVSDDKPMTIAAIDNEDKLRNVLPAVRPMVREGLIGLTDFELIP